MKYLVGVLALAAMAYVVYNLAFGQPDGSIRYMGLKGPMSLSYSEFERQQ